MMSKTQIEDAIRQAEAIHASSVDETTLAAKATKRNFLPGVPFGLTLEFPKNSTVIPFKEVAKNGDSITVYKVLCSMNDAPYWLPLAKLQATQDLINAHEVDDFCVKLNLDEALALHNAPTLLELVKAVAGKKLVFNQLFTGERIRSFDGKPVKTTIALPKTA